MSAEKNKALTRHFYEEIFSKGNFVIADELIDTNCVDHNPLIPGQAIGLEGAKQVYTMVRTAFPDLRVTIEDQVAEGDKVVSRLTMRGTHRGRFMGIAPTDKVGEAEIIDIVRIDNKKIVERWGILDQIKMMKQLGVSPPAK